MSFIDKWIERKVDKRVSEEIKSAIYQPGIKYQMLNGKIVSPTDNKTTYIQSGYEINDIVYSVVNLILDKVRLPYWNINKIVSQSSLKKYEALMARKNLSGKDWKKALSYKEDAMEPLTTFNLQQGKLKDLLTYPNEEYVWSDHVTNSAGFKLLTGDCYDYGTPLKEGANAGIPNSIDTMPAHLMTIKAGDSFPPRATSYELMTFNQKFTKEEILHEKYWNPDWNVSGSQLYGLSPLKAALKNLTRNNSAKDSSTAKFQNGGVEGVMFFNDPRFNGTDGKQQAEQLKQKWSGSEYSGPDAQGKVAISGYNMGYIPLGLSPVELNIIESEKWDAVMFCNIYGVPPELMGLVQKTYNNVKEAEKALTTRCAIPLLTSKKNYLNWKFQTNWGFKGQNIYVDYDTECFTELQVDITETLTGITKLTLRTPNEEREAIGWNARKEPEADELWVSQGGSMVPLSDFQANQVDAALMAEATINNGTANNTNGQAAMANGNGKVSSNGVGKILSH